MRLTVHPFGDLRRVLPRGQESLSVELPDGSSSLDLLKQIDIHPGEVWIVRANKQVVKEGESLHDGDEVELFEPVGGGSGNLRNLPYK